MSAIKFLRFKRNKETSYGLLEGESVVPIQGNPFAEWRRMDFTYAMEEIELLAPCEPSKIVAIGLNYYEHAEESNEEVPTEPVIFLEPSTAVIGPEAKIIYPSLSTHVDYEAELAVVIKERTTKVSKAEARGRILGYTCANDVTARDIQFKDKQWARGKSFDTFLPLGPVISDELDPTRTRIQLRLNGAIKQDSNTNQMVFDVYELVSYISRMMTLLPGDVIITGTPKGIGPLNKGDKVEVTIEGIGTLRNYVA